MKEGKVKKPFYKRWWFFVIVGIVVLGAIGGGGEDKNQTSTPNTEKQETSEAQDQEASASQAQEESKQDAIEVTTTGAELAEAYEANEIKANQDYKGKLAEITGTVENIGESLGSTYITLASGKDFSIVSVQCFFKDKDEIAKIAELSKGTEVTVVGKIDGLSMNVGVSNCKFK